MGILQDTHAEEFPYRGVFFTETTDPTVSPLNRVVVRKDVLETACDIQQKSVSLSDGTSAMVTTVYFPAGGDIPVKIGMGFEGEAQGVSFLGFVYSIWPSQLGACSCQIRLNDVD